MNLRIKITIWFLLSVIVLAATLLFAAHNHLDEELREDRWDRSHPKFPDWVIHGSYSDEEVHDILAELFHVWALVGIPLVLVAAGVGYGIAVLSVRPVREINRQMKVLDWQGAEQGIPTPNSDPEIVELVSNLNSLLARLSTSFHEMSDFSSKVAHELRTPLTLLRMRVEKDAPSLPPDFSEDIQEEIRRLSQLVERSLLAAKAERGRVKANPVVINLSNLLNDLREYYIPEAESKGMVFEWDFPPTAYVRSDPELLRQVFHNLLGNTMRHGNRRARLRVRSACGGKQIAVTISNFMQDQQTKDHGIGLGQRLVCAIAAVLPQTSFRFRKSRTCFASRLVFRTLPQAAAPASGNSTLSPGQSASRDR